MVLTSVDNRVRGTVMWMRGSMIRARVLLMLTPMYDNEPWAADANGYWDGYADLPHGYLGDYGVACPRGQYR